MSRLSKRRVWAEMARRKKLFHANKEWNQISLWGLFQWGRISHMLNSGELITHMKKENVTVWVVPSESAYKKNIEPLLNLTIEELDRMAGWTKSEC